MKNCWNCDNFVVSGGCEYCMQNIPMGTCQKDLTDQMIYDIMEVQDEKEET